MSKSFFIKNLRRYKQVDSGAKPIIEPCNIFPIGEIPIMGTVKDNRDIQITSTLIQMSIDECEEVTKSVQKLKDMYGEAPIFKEAYKGALELSMEVEYLIAQLDWKLKAHFNVLASDDIFLYLYSGWVVSTHIPGAINDGKSSFQSPLGHA
jgi:hypothetical protein